MSVGSYTKPSGSLTVVVFLSMLCFIMSFSSLIETFSFAGGLFFLFDFLLYFSFSALMIFLVESEGFWLSSSTPVTSSPSSALVDGLGVSATGVDGVLGVDLLAGGVSGAAFATMFFVETGETVEVA